MDQLIERKNEILQGSFQMHFLVEKVDAEIARLRVLAGPPPAPPPPQAKTSLRNAGPPPPPARRVSVLKAETRNRFLHEAIEDLRHARAQLKQCEESIERLRNEKQAFRVGEVLKRAQDKKEALQIEIVNFERRVEDIEEGNCDEEFLVLINANIARAAKPRRAPPPPPPPPPPQRKFIHRGPPQPPLLPAGEVRDFAYEKYMRECDKFPQHMRDKLKSMPCNQGFLYRDTSWFGELPERPGPTVLTERHDLGGGAFEIYEHVYTPTSYVIYKRGRRGAQKQIVRRIK